LERNKEERMKGNGYELRERKELQKIQEEIRRQESKKLKLNLGCGTKKLAGYVNVDILHNADAVHDLNKFPYPWKDSNVDNIYMSHVLEHLDNPKRVMDEIWRICRNGALVTIKVPWYKSWTTLWNPLHKHEFAPRWFEAFDHGTNAFTSVYGGSIPSSVNFKILSSRKKKMGVRIFRCIKGITHMGVSELEVVMEVVKE
jgi:SAM-dependent methyltransferase